MKKYLVVFGACSKTYFVTEHETWLQEYEKKIVEYNDFNVAFEVAEVLNKNKEK